MVFVSTAGAPLSYLKYAPLVSILPLVPHPYDYLRLNFFNPAQIFANGRIETHGAYFQYTKQVPSLETNLISSNSHCGTNIPADCDFGLEIQGEDSVGMIIQNHNGKRHNGTIYVYDGTGTLNGPTDYAAEPYSSPTVGSVNYTKEHQQAQ